jgi:hypothetical protein
MQASQKIIIKQATINAITDGAAGAKALLLDELTTHDKDMLNLLTSYHWEERGVVETVKIEAESLIIDQNGTGKFNVNYAVNIHYGCSDVQIDLDKKMTISIYLDVRSGEALLTGEFFPEREPDGL